MQAGTWSAPVPWSTSQTAARNLRGSGPIQSPMNSGCARPLATVDHAGSSGAPRMRWGSNSQTVSIATTTLATGLLCESRPTLDCAWGAPSRMQPIRCTTPDVCARLRHREQETGHRNRRRGGVIHPHHSHRPALDRAGVPFRQGNSASARGQANAQTGDPGCDSPRHGQGTLLDRGPRIGPHQHVTEIAEREGKVERHIRLLAPLAFIPPRTLAAIIDGTGPHDATPANAWERDRIASKIVELVQAGEIDPQRLRRTVIGEIQHAFATADRAGADRCRCFRRSVCPTSHSDGSNM
jgi:hypothetical protein